MKKYLLLSGFAVLMGLQVIAQTTTSTRSVAGSEEGLVKWMTIEEAVEKSRTEKRSIFVDVYTDWCGWCKVMDKNTFNEPQIAKILNEKYYAVKLNAEQEGDIVLKGTTFKFVPYGNKGSHQLAMALLDNKMSYPTVVFLDAEMKTKYPMPGYVQPPQFHKFLLFFSKDQSASGQNAWADFEKSYVSPYPPVPAGN